MIYRGSMYEFRSVKSKDFELFPYGACFYRRYGDDISYRTMANGGCHPLRIHACRHYV